MLTQETISKISTIILRPGVYEVNFRSEASQIWINVRGSLESINVVAELQFLFPNMNVIDSTDYVLKNTDDRVADYHLHSDGLIITVTGWLPKEKDSDESEPTVKNSTSDFTINDMPVEEYLKREA